MNPQPTQGDKKDTINPTVELENVESNVRDSAALAIDALEDELRAVQRISAVIQNLISYIPHERETLKQLEERCAELIKVIENFRLQILEQTEADQAKLDEEIEEIINMNINSPDNLTGFSERALDGNFNEELPKKSGEESSIVTVTEPDLETNYERDDESFDESQPDANNMIDNNVGGAETENEVASDIKQDTEEQLEAGKQQFAAEEKLSKTGSTVLMQEE